MQRMSAATHRWNSPEKCEASVLFAKVIGNVVSTQKTGHLDGLPLMVVRFLDERLEPSSRTAVAVDTVSAKPDDLVLLCSSSSARMTVKTRDVCTDLTIVGIVDAVSMKKKDVYPL
jgi:microcompartment protein CcmK/EutM